MFSLGNKKDISIFRMKKAPYVLLWIKEVEITGVNCIYICSDGSICKSSVSEGIRCPRV